MRRAKPPIHPLVLVAVGLASSLAFVGNARLTLAEGPTASRPQDLGLSLQAAELAELLAPRDRWDADFVVSRVGKDPKKLFDWVRANSYWIPYQGALRGPVGVLMDGRGNSLDRALLLADLLKRAGHNVRLARAGLSKQEAVKRLDDLVAREASATDEIDIAGSNVGTALNAATVQFARGPGQATSALAQQAKETAQKTSAIEARVGAQTKRLLALAPAKDAGAEQDARFGDAIEALQDHWWVQRESSSGWLDMDAFSADGEAIASADSTAEVKEVAELALYHQVTLRLIVERWQPGSLTEHVAMVQPLRPADLIGRSVVLQFWPTAPFKALTPAGRLELKEAKGGEWAGMLFIDSQSVNAGILQESGTDPDASPSPAGGGGGFGGGAFGGAFGQPAQPPATGKSSLSAVWLEYEIRVPGEKPQKIRREIFDLVGPALRAGGAPKQFALTDAQRAKRDQALIMRNEILLVPTRIAPEFVTHLVSQSLLANGELLTTAMQPKVTTEKVVETARRSGPTATALYGLALSATAGQGNSTYVDRPMVFTNHSYPKADGTVIEATDIVANDIGVSLAVQNGYALRMAEGVRHTSAESLLQRVPVSGNTSDAFAASTAWVAVKAGDEATIEGLKISADAKRRILQDVANGNVVVAPRSATTASWWRIDPVTGTTLGIGENGWGTSMGEHGSQSARAGATAQFFKKAFGRFASGFIGAYGWCVAPKITDNLETRGFTGLKLTISNSAGQCAAEGVFWGAFATLPLVILTYNRSRAPRVPEVPPPAELPPGPPPEPPCPVGTKVMPKRPGAGNTQPMEPIAPKPPAAAEEGPFQMSKENKDWHREGYADGHPAALAMGDPAIFDFADRAAASTYNGGRARGMSHAQALQASKNMWMAAVKQGQGTTLVVEGLTIPSGKFGTTVEIAAVPGSGPTPPLPRGTQPMGPPLGSPPPGSSPPLGSPPPGSSPPLGSPPPGSSPPLGSAPPGSSPPLGSPPPGSSPPLGSPPPGSSPPLGSSPPGSMRSPMATTMSVPARPAQSSGGSSPPGSIQSPNASSGPVPATPMQSPNSSSGPVPVRPAQAPAGGGRRIDPISVPEPLLTTPQKLAELPADLLESMIDANHQEIRDIAPALREARPVTQKATEAYVRHRANKPNPGRDWPGDPDNYSPATDQKLRNEMEAAMDTSFPLSRRTAEAQARIEKLMEARDLQRAAEHNAMCGGQ